MRERPPGSSLHCHSASSSQLELSCDPRLHSLTDDLALCAHNTMLFSFNPLHPLRPCRAIRKECPLGIARAMTTRAVIALHRCRVRCCRFRRRCFRTSRSLGPSAALTNGEPPPHLPPPRLRRHAPPAPPPPRSIACCCYTPRAMRCPHHTRLPPPTIRRPARSHAARIGRSAHLTSAMPGVTRLEVPKMGCGGFTFVWETEGL